MSAESESTSKPPLAPNVPATPAAPAEFRLGRVLKLAAPIALVLIGGAVFIGFFDGLKRIETWSRPAMMSVTGQVLYNGEPLDNGLVVFSSRGLPNAIGATDSQGRFKLQIDIDGQYVDGAYVGEYVVTVTKNEPQPGASPPKLLTPLIYSTTATSPLRFTISPTAEKNEFKIPITGEPAPPTPPPPPPPPPPTPPSSDPSPESKKDAERVPSEDAPAKSSDSTTPKNKSPTDADQP